MRAAVCDAYGPPEQIRVREVPSPAVSAGQVRVRVGAAAVNFPDVLLMANTYQLTVPAPFVPGSEFAGLIAEIGAGVAGLAVGDRVMGTTITGAFAAEVVVPATSITSIPDGVDDVHAAAFGVAHRTAYHVLRSVARVQPGERLVVLGAGGGIGLINHVSVTSDATDAIGASDAADSSGASAAGGLRQALRAAFPDGVDVVVDPVGGDLAEPALRALRWGGRFVTVGYASGTVPRIPLNLVLLKGCRILGFQFRDFAAHAPDELARNETALLQLLAAGRALPHVGTTFALAEAAAALRQVADGKAVGKVVLVIGLGETVRSVRDNQNLGAERTRGDYRTSATDRSAGPS
jgi:NADPH:quinone reductase